jgi:hypothetical protein
LEGLVGYLILLLQNIGIADIAYEDEVVGIEENILNGIQPVLLIEKTEKDVGFVRRVVPSKVRRSRAWIEMSQ